MSMTQMENWAAETDSSLGMPPWHGLLGDELWSWAIPIVILSSGLLNVAWIRWLASYMQCKLMRAWKASECSCNGLALLPGNSSGETLLSTALAVSQGKEFELRCFLHSREWWLRHVARTTRLPIWQHNSTFTFAVQCWSAVENNSRVLRWFLLHRTRSKAWCNILHVTGRSIILEENGIFFDIVSRQITAMGRFLAVLIWHSFGHKAGSRSRVEFFSGHCWWSCANTYAALNTSGHSMHSGHSWRHLYPVSPMDHEISLHLSSLVPVT